ncbi:hypothetical protein L596_000801 [Steinernema carpocapsae]|uniref:Uncharacterized protein n=1 Tax=Steinernema carpocapsae TaxID=34508 RepID=A0A4U8ULM3_STECR|nr:hypothetical protein L596_000801 [Steinernema carpocapsae]
MKQFRDRGAIWQPLHFRLSFAKQNYVPQEVKMDLAFHVKRNDRIKLRSQKTVGFQKSSRLINLLKKHRNAV